MKKVKNPQLEMETQTSRSALSLQRWNSRRGGVPEGCRVGWAGRAGGGRARACSGGREEGRAGALEGSPAA